jgi:hypothetical protein
VQRTDTVAAVVRLARARLFRAAGRAALGRWGARAFAVAFFVAAVRPLLWPSPDGAPPWLGAARALALFAVALVVGLAVVIVAGRRRGPSELGAARAIDEALGRPEVVASGWAFAREGRAGPLVELVSARARHAAQGVDVAAAFPLPSVRPARRTVLLLGPLGLAALLAGAYPPELATESAAAATETERLAADLVDRLATEIERRAARSAEERRRDAARDAAGGSDRSRGRDRAGESRGRSERGDGATDAETDGLAALTAEARAAAAAARRGQREEALRRLAEVRRGAAEADARERELDRLLRELERELGEGERSGGSDGLQGRVSQIARDARATAADEERQRLAERIERAAGMLAEAAARRGQRGDDGERGDSAETQGEQGERADAETMRRLAEALERAAEALARGDMAAADAALGRAGRDAAGLDRALERAASESSGRAAMTEATAELERALQLAMLGRGEPGGSMSGEASPGAGGGESPEAEALRRELAERLARMGGSGAPGSGGPDGTGATSRGRGELASGPRPEVAGSLHAPSQVREGEQAAAAIRGLGRRGEPTAEYRDVFPSYDAVAEEAIQDEQVPAARRAAVRRYFEAIRPEE